MLPRKIKVLGRPWKVKSYAKLELEGVPCMGLCDFQNKTLMILKGMSAADTKETLLHEWFHACWAEAGLHDECLQPWIEHMILNAVVKELCSADEFWANFLLQSD